MNNRTCQLGGGCYFVARNFFLTGQEKIFLSSPLSPFGVLQIFILGWKCRRKQQALQTCSDACLWHGLGMIWQAGTPTRGPLPCQLLSQRKSRPFASLHA